MKKILIIFGTRPEAIKLAPVVNSLKKEKDLNTIVCSTGQHREMLKQVLDIFNFKVDYDLDLMRPNQDLYDITEYSIKKLKNVFNEIKPDLLIIQGDTTTAFISALGAYYSKIKIAHVEAGLRSFNNYSPFPEEANRKFVSVIADFHFTPTATSKENLLNEGISRKKIFVTGNTVIDSLQQVKIYLGDPDVQNKIIYNNLKYLPQNFPEQKFVLITMHRREKFGKEFQAVLQTIKALAKKHRHLNFVYPVHLNPNVQKPVREILNDSENIYLLPPLDYLTFIYLMSKTFFILTDSGGIQEEAFVFKKPVIVMRDVTERTEAIDAGYAFLTGSSSEKITKTFNYLNEHLEKRHNFFKGKNPYGNGKASEKIVKKIREHL